MSFTLFSFAMLLICFLCIGKELFLGFKGGLFLSLLSFSSIISSIILAVILSRALSVEIANAIMLSLRDDIMNAVGMTDMAASLERVILFLLQAIVCSLVFAALFLISKLFIKLILKWVLKKKVKRFGSLTDAQAKKDKLYGAVVGGICGVIVAAAVTAPIMGTLHTARDAVSVINVLDEEMLSTSNLKKSSFDVIDNYASDFCGNFCYSFGGELIYSQIAVGEFNGKTVSAVSEIKHLANGIKSVLEIVDRFSEEELDLSQELDVSELYEVIDNSEIIKTIVAEGIAEFSQSWLRGDSFIGISRPNFNDNLDPLVDGLLTVCAETNVYNVKETVGTLVDIFSLLAECGIRADSKTEDIDYYLLVTKLYDVLNENPNMEPVKDSLLKLATGAFSDAILENVSITELNNFYKLVADKAMIAYSIDTNDIDVKKEELKSGLSEFLLPYGISDDDNVIELVVERVLLETEMNGGWMSAGKVAEIFSITTKTE